MKTLYTSTKDTDLDDRHRGFIQSKRTLSVDKDWSRFVFGVECYTKGEWERMEREEAWEWRFHFGPITAVYSRSDCYWIRPLAAAPRNIDHVRHHQRA
jgi:hypothetical protein